MKMWPASTEVSLSRSEKKNSGCMAALDAEHYLQEIGSQTGKND